MAKNRRGYKRLGRGKMRIFVPAFYRRNGEEFLKFARYRHGRGKVIVFA